MNFITLLLATISFMSLIAYDAICICRIFKKEQIVEYAWSKIVPNVSYDEKRMFLVIRPIFFQISFLCFLLSPDIFMQNPICNIALSISPILAIATGIRNNRKR